MTGRDDNGTGYMTGRSDNEAATIRLSLPEDAAVLSEISLASMNSAWSMQDFLDAINGTQSVVLSAIVEDEIAGYMVMYHAADEGEIPSVAVKHSLRRTGVGHALMNELFSRARSLGLTRIFLEVRRSNAAAIALYESHGFLCAGERKRFYTDPVEDALIYTTVI